MRLRDDRAAPYQEAEWIDLLKRARSPAAGAAAAHSCRDALAGVDQNGGRNVRGGDCRAIRPSRRWSRRRQALSPDRRALRELMRLQQTPVLTLNTSDYHSLLSDVVRRYLAVRL